MTSPSDLDQKFLRDVDQTQCYIHDDDAQNKEHIQGLTFLRSGVRPAVGQRVDLKVNMQASETWSPGPHFYLAGNVVQVGETPAVRPMEHCNDVGPGNGSMGFSGFLVEQVFPKVRCSDPRCVAMHPDVNAAPRFGRFCMQCHGIHGTGWEEEEEDADSAWKQGVVTTFISVAHRAFHGGLHGQEVVCEGRLHFDVDLLHRGTEEGPWDDGIPLDGRDVWRYTLVCDDSKVNPWVLMPGSFRNMGRNHRPRCWPWSGGNELPVRRDGVNRFHRNYGLPVPMTMCIGPFGCDGTDAGGNVHAHHYHHAGAA